MSIDQNLLGHPSSIVAAPSSSWALGDGEASVFLSHAQAIPVLNKAMHALKPIAMIAAVLKE